MSLRPLYDEDQVSALAIDLSEILILPQGDEYGYERMDRKLYANGWRKIEEE